MRTAFRVNQLRGGAHPNAAFAHRAFQDVSDAPFAPHLLHVNRLTFVGEARIAGDHEQPTDTAEGGDYFLDHPIGKIFLLRVAAHVLEWQHCDRRLVWQGKGRRRFNWRSAWRGLSGGEPHAVDPDRASYVFDSLIAHVVEDQIKLVADLIVDDRRHTNPTRFSDPFQSGRDINAIAVDVVVLRDDDVAEVDADP